MTSHHRSAPAKQAGFTLIELMIAMVVVAILTAIAIPSYGAYVQRATRADAKSQMYKVQQFMERFYAMNNAYDQMLNGAAVALPAALSQSPASGAARYQITLSAINPGNYTVQAVPQAAQSTDKCGTLTLSNTNVRGAGGAANATELAACWR